MPSKSPRDNAPPFGSTESAQQVWLAGLGALTRAQQEGSKVFDALVQEGLAMQRRAQSTAEARLAEASEKVSNLAQEFSQRAGGQWDKIEGLFEERVARALQRLGMPSAQEVQALRDRITMLEAQLGARAPAKTATPRTTAGKTAPRKAAGTARKPRS